MAVNASTFKDNTTGVYIGAGNTSMSGGNVTGNTTGIYVDSGGNHAHGIIDGVNINHNITDGIYINQITLGMTFSDCHIFGNRITLNASYGVNIIGGMGSPTFNMVGTFTGYNFVKNFWFASTEPTITATAAQRKYLRIEQSTTTTSDTSTNNYGISPKHGGTGNTEVFAEGSIPMVYDTAGTYKPSAYFTRGHGDNLLKNTGTALFTGAGGTALTLNTGFHGNVGLVVKGATDTQPAAVQPDSVSGIYYWFKADTLSLNDGDAVTTWTDSSGSARNATQATASAKPTYKTSLLNGKPVVRFDGGDSLATASSTVTQPLTTFIVSRASVMKNQIRFTMGSNYVYNDTTSGASFYAGGTPYTFTTNVLQWNIWDYASNGASSDIVVNGGTPTTGNPGSTGTATGAKIGDHTSGGFGLEGDIAEIIVYSGSLSNADREKIRRYLTEKYGIYTPNGTTGGSTAQTANLQEWQNSAGTALSAVTASGALGLGDATPDGFLDVEPTGAVTTASYGLNLSNLTTNATTDAINKYGAYLTSTGTWTGSGGTATNNYGLYVDTVSGADNNYGAYIAGNVGIGDTTPASLFTVGNGDLFQVSSLGNVSTTGQINGTDGIVTKVNAGACDDTTFTLDTNGNLCVDSTNGRIYYRYGGAWHYSAQTAGFQIPNYEAYAYDFTTHEFDTARHLAQDDFLIPFVENFMEDGAVHGLYAKFSDVKDTLLSDEKGQISALTLQTNQSINTLAELQGSVDDQLTVVGNTLTKQGGDIEEVGDEVTTLKDTVDTHSDLLATLAHDVNTSTSQTALLKTEVEVLTEQLSTLSDFYTTFDLGNILSKDSLGNVDLLGSKLTAHAISADSILGKRFLIASDGGEGETIGESAIEEGETSVVVETETVSVRSRIFVTPRVPFDGSLAVTEKEPGESFTVEISKNAETDIPFDWWIVEEKPAE